MKHLLQELYGGDARDAYENAVISLHSLEVDARSCRYIIDLLD